MAGRFDDNASQSCTSAFATPSPKGPCANARKTAFARSKISRRSSASVRAVAVAATALPRCCATFIASPACYPLLRPERIIAASPRRPNERRCEGHPAPEQGAVQRTHRHQPVLPARPHARQLGAEEAARGGVQGVDRRDEARRPP